MEQIYAIVILDDNSERLGPLWASANSQQKVQMETTSRYLAGTELSESARAWKNFYMHAFRSLHLAVMT